MSKAVNNKPDLQARLQDMSLFLDRAIQDAASMKSVQLGNMEKDIHDLCHKIESSDPDTAHGIKSDMAEIINKLDQLAEGLADYKSKIENTGA